MRRSVAVVVVLSAAVANGASRFPQTNQQPKPPCDLSLLSQDPNFEDVSDIPNVVVSLRYASQNNFLQKDVYGDLHQCFLHRIAAVKLRSAAKMLREQRPGWKLLVFDCLRPRSVQAKLFAAVKGTVRQPYVADPRNGSIHNYGFAIDLSLQDQNGHELDMGTGFDDFSPVSQPSREQEYLAAGKLTKEQLEHRLLLRKIMIEAGFIQLPIEWWHYDALPKEEVKKQYKVVE